MGSDFNRGWSDLSDAGKTAPTNTVNHIFSVVRVSLCVSVANLYPWLRKIQIQSIHYLVFTKTPKDNTQLEGRKIEQWRLFGII